MLKVVWIVPGFSSSDGDWCIPALLDLARSLAQRCELTIVAMRYPCRRDTYRIAGATVHSIGGGHRGTSFTPGIWRDTARAVANIPCDVLHAFWAYEPGTIAAWFASRMPVAISLAGGELVYLPEIQYGLMGKPRTRILIRWALRRARVVTAGSPSLMEQAQKTLALPALHHIPLGVDLQRWPLSPHDANPPVIINVGSLAPVKGQAILLQAFKHVLLQIPAARLCIVGGGGERTELERLALDLGLSRSVDFAGAILHNQMPSFYAGSSLFVQSSWHESQGMALLEAAASGLPIAGTDVGAITNFAPDAAIVSPIGDVHRLAAAILKILEHRDEAATLATKARQRVEEFYGMETVTSRFLQLYESISWNGRRAGL